MAKVTRVRHNSRVRRSSVGSMSAFMYIMYVQNMKMNKKSVKPPTYLSVLTLFLKLKRALIRMAKDKNDLVEFEGLNAEHKKKSGKISIPVSGWKFIYGFSVRKKVPEKQGQNLPMTSL